MNQGIEIQRFQVSEALVNISLVSAVFLYS
jgi:hypothetical protein